MDLFLQSKRIVIKIGTSSLTYESGQLNYRHIENMTDVICDLKNMGHQVVLVSSGASGVGLGKLGLTKKPDTSAEKRVLAACGQSGLMAMYESFFGRYHCKVAQVLLTKSVMNDQEKAKSIIKSFEEMFNYDVLPIVNENDVISSDELNSDDMFGDNDTLSARVAALIKADILVIWSDIDGLYNKDPRTSKDAKLISVVSKVTDNIYNMAGGAGSLRGKGGMRTKIYAARIATEAGVDMVIANSSRPELLYDLFHGKSIGTLFKAQANHI